MKLITELSEQVHYIEESADEGKSKQFFIEGIFMQAEQVNKNKRFYPISVMEKEVNRYRTDYIDQKRSFGELGHPEGPMINLDRISHLITELKRDGNNFIGKAKLVDTPSGNIAKGIITSGGRIGVSSRALGSLKRNFQGINEVQSDFHLATAADIVVDPSAPDAFVQGIMEGVDFFWENGSLKAEQVCENAKQRIEKASKVKKLDENAKLEIFNRFLQEQLSKFENNI